MATTVVALCETTCHVMHAGAFLFGQVRGEGCRGASALGHPREELLQAWHCSHCIVGRTLLSIAVLSIAVQSLRARWFTDCARARVGWL